MEKSEYQITAVLFRNECLSGSHRIRQLALQADSGGYKSTAIEVRFRQLYGTLLSDNKK